MLNWLSLWGRRLWRSCCYPFQVLPFHDSCPPAVPEVPEESAPREFPSNRMEAIRQGIIIAPQFASPLDGLPQKKSATVTELELEDALMLPGEAWVDCITDSPSSSPTALEADEALPSPRISQANQNPDSGMESAVTGLPFNWVLENRLAIGALPRTAWEQDLEAQGINVIISLCDEVDGQLPPMIAQRCRCVRVPLPDRRSQRSLTVEELADAVDLIHWHVQKQQPVYLHCVSGIEQSPLVAIAYLSRYRTTDFLEMVACLSYVYSPSFPIAAQLHIVREYLQTCS